MPRRQRFLKFLILCFMPIGVIGGIGALAGTFWYYFSAQKYLVAATSPSQRYRALIIRERDSDDCGSSGGRFIVVQRKSGFFKTGEMPVFCVSEDGSENLNIRWSGSNELTIACPHCEDGTFRFYNGRWGDFSFRLEH
jgi:hypothetical protein